MVKASHWGIPEKAGYGRRRENLPKRKAEDLQEEGLCKFIKRYARRKTAAAVKRLPQFYFIDQKPRQAKVTALGQ